MSTREKLDTSITTYIMHKLLIFLHIFQGLNFPSFLHSFIFVVLLPCLCSLHRYLHTLSLRKAQHFTASTEEKKGLKKTRTDRSHTPEQLYATDNVRKGGCCCDPQGGYDWIPMSDDIGNSRPIISNNRATGLFFGNFWGVPEH